MSLKVKRLNGSDASPHSCEVTIQLPAASIVLWHMCRLPGARVIAKKSWAMTDDFEGYFLYKSRLFLLETPFVNIELSMLGQPANEVLWAEVEAHLRTSLAPAELGPRLRAGVRSRMAMKYFTREWWASEGVGTRDAFDAYESYLEANLTALTRVLGSSAAGVHGISA